MQFAKDFTYLVFKTVRLCSCVLEVFEVWKELLVNKLHKVITTHCINGIQYHLARLRVFLLRCCPLAPAIETWNQSLIGLAFQFGFILTLCFKVIKVFQEQHPWFLFQVVQLATATLLLPQNLVYCLKCIFVFHYSISVVLSAYKDTIIFQHHNNFTLKTCYQNIRVSSITRRSILHTYF